MPPLGTAVRRSAQIIVGKIAAQAYGLGRLFLRFIIIFASDGVSETETGQAYAKNRYQSFYRQHPQALL